MLRVDAKDDRDVSSNPLHVFESHYLPYRIRYVSDIHQRDKQFSANCPTSGKIFPVTYPEKCPCGQRCPSSRCGMYPQGRVHSQTALLTFFNKRGKHNVNSCWQRVQTKNMWRLGCQIFCCCSLCLFLPQLWNSLIDSCQRIHSTKAQERWSSTVEQSSNSQRQDNTKQ